MGFSSPLKLASCVLVFFLSTLAQAQPAPGGSSGSSEYTDTAKYEVGFHLGNLLPNQINGVREIIGLGGLRGGYRIGEISFAEFGVTMGNGEGVQWKNLNIDYRFDIPVEGLLAFAYVGGDTTYYKGVGQGTRLIFGGHAGGGFKANLGGNTWFRADMKFGFSPGTSLYIGAGLEFRFGESK